ncbi:MAG TPA: glycoside hydrolase family 9 protein [Polyangiaceae bacterium]|nr:glycoside hydrolase family 9 protein [Polyangiaceae bacterium]
MPARRGEAAGSFADDLAVVRPRRELCAAIPCAALGCVLAVGCGAGATDTASAAGGAPPVAASPASSESANPPAPPPTALTPAQLTELLKPLHVALSQHNLLKNSSFEGSRSLPWMTSFTAPGSGEAHVESGAYCLHVANAGAHPWDVQFRHREMTIRKGHHYTLRFKIGSTVPTQLEVKVAMSGPPYKAYWHQGLDLGAAPQVFTSDFTMGGDDDPTAELTFHAGGKTAAKQAPFAICVDDVVLEDPEFEPMPEPSPPAIPNVLVNQLGYLPMAPKVAIVKTASETPVPWLLLDRLGHTVASGSTLAHGADPASGDDVQWADFTSVSKPAAGYTIKVGADQSHPFEIGPRLYRKLKYDALAFFYQNRSGIAIAMPYAGDPKWARPAGHPGDKSVPCAPDARCEYSLDVSGGWYDAGDHGKYVVNGGISVWTLLDQYERAKALGSSASDFADGTMNIPERHNSVPDLLDEARWELDFLIKMQVPEGHPLSGMAHHKIHDREWTALATRPSDDPVPRFLRPVSTAATLNLAATAAQGARVWSSIDPAFATRCLQSAERAWTAAVANPAMIAPVSDGVGGGAYDDGDVSDEFYWAASELFITTKKAVYADFLQKSPHRLSVPTDAGGQATSMTWGATAALGTISLALVPSALPRADVAAARAAIVKAADAYVAIARDQGYRLVFKPAADGYPWGSNSFVLNNALVTALAYDLSKDRRYLDVTAEAMDYVLGRNPNDQSYITGYGFRPLEHPHHRFWAHQANAAFPSPPPGVMSGGPNSGLQDPYVQAFGLQGCAPEKCYVDNIEAWSANEEAINWNAPLAWVAAFLDEQSERGRL